MINNIAFAQEAVPVPNSRSNQRPQTRESCAVNRLQVRGRHIIGSCGLLCCSAEHLLANPST